MSHARFYCAELRSGMMALPAQEARHAGQARRMRVGDPLTVFDGLGREAEALVREIGPRRLTVEIKEIQERAFELSLRLTLATAVPKAHRQGFLVEKCTELGVAAIWPMACQQSVVAPNQKAVERWRRAALEAGKQCGAAWLPEIGPPYAFEEVVARAREFDSLLMADQEGDMLANVVPIPVRESRSILALVGPEGGWTDEERTQARAAGGLTVRLGPRVLRVETACVALAAFAASAGELTSSASGRGQLSL